MDTRLDREWTTHLVGERDQRFGLKECGTFSAILKKCHPIATAVASITLPSCYGQILKQHSTSASILDDEIMKLPAKAGKPEISCGTNGGRGHSRMRRRKQNDSEGNNSIWGWVNHVKASKTMDRWELKKGKEIESELSSCDNVFYVLKFTASYNNYSKQKIITRVIRNRHVSEIEGRGKCGISWRLNHVR